MISAEIFCFGVLNFGIFNGKWLGMYKTITKKQGKNCLSVYFSYNNNKTGYPTFYSKN